MYHLLLFTDAVILAKEKVDSPLLKVKFASPLNDVTLEMQKNTLKFVLEISDGHRLFRVLSLSLSLSPSLSSLS